MSITVVKPGLLTTVQDRGRHGLAALGIGHSGPMDEAALRLANALAGNQEGAAALELTLLGPQLRFNADSVIALTGAAFDAHVDGVPLPGWQPLPIRAGALLDLGSARHGARAYLAVAGGLAVERVLRSAASDVNAGLGPFAGRALRAGDSLSIGNAAAALRPDTHTRAAQHGKWSLDPRPWFDVDPTRPIRMVRGTHFTLLDASSRAALYATEFRLHPDSNRVGFRFDGTLLTLVGPLELVSEPVASGTLQLPPDGRPIALMAEHPTTGGYPRIGQIAAVDLPGLAQRRPGERVRFVETCSDEAQTRYLERERELARLLDVIATRLATND